MSVVASIKARMISLLIASCRFRFSARRPRMQISPTHATLSGPIRASMERAAPSRRAAFGVPLCSEAQEHAGTQMERRLSFAVIAHERSRAGRLRASAFHDELARFGGLFLAVRLVVGGWACTRNPRRNRDLRPAERSSALSADDCRHMPP